MWDIPVVPFSVFDQELEVLRYLCPSSLHPISLSHPLFPLKESVEKWRKNQIHPYDHCVVFPDPFHGNVKFVVIGKFQASEGGALRISIISLSTLGFLVSLCA